MHFLVIYEITILSRAKGACFYNSQVGEGENGRINNHMQFQWRS